MTCVLLYMLMLCDDGYAYVYVDCDDAYAYIVVTVPDDTYMCSICLFPSYISTVYLN